MAGYNNSSFEAGISLLFFILGLSIGSHQNPLLAGRSRRFFQVGLLKTLKLMWMWHVPLWSFDHSSLWAQYMLLLWYLVYNIVKRHSYYDGSYSNIRAIWWYNHLNFFSILCHWCHHIRSTMYLYVTLKSLPWRHRCYCRDTP